MKRIWNLIAGAVTLLAFAACQDVPAPYQPKIDGGDTGSLPYSSTSLNDWTTMAVNGKGNPWSTGSSYTQATGYQKWEGDTKTNKECEGVLVSPALYTKTDSTKVKMAVDYCVGYASNDPDFKSHIKVYASTTYKDGDEFKPSEWTLIEWTATHTSTDWTLKTEEVQLPEAFVNKENVHVAYWFYSPADKSCTFEVKNFKMSAGTAGGGGGEGGDAKGSGTLEAPYNPAGANAFIATLGDDKESDNNIYVKGKISSIKEAPSSQFGNATFYVSEDGTEAGAQFYAFRVYYLGNKKFTGSEELKVGDDVIICGKVVNYKGNTPETVGNKAFVYSHNGKTDGGEPEPGPTPTGDNLLKNGDFETWTSGLPDNWKSSSSASSATLKQSTTAHGGKYAVAVEGADANKRIAYKELKLKKGTYAFSFYAKAGTSDKCQCRPGYVPVTDGAVGSYAYGDYANLKASEWTLVSHTFTLDATTTVCLVVMNPKGGTSYQDTQDILIDDASLVSSDGGIEGGDDPQPTPTPEEAKGAGTLTDPYNPVAANAYINTLGADKESANDIYVKGKISSIKEAPSAKYGNATFYVSEDGKENSTQFYAFRVYYLGNKKFTGSETLKVGDDVIICGKVVNYMGNTPETASNKAYIYSHNGKTDGGGDPEPEPEPEPTPGGNLLVNGDFESWSGEQPTNWKSACTASSATLKQSSEAHGGKYSVEVVGTTSNKRLGYKEMKLAAGNYKFTFYAKATTSDKCQCRPGYVPVGEDGSVGSYAYGDYATLTTSGWTQVTHSFTLDAETTVCLVVMNPKGGSAYMDTQSILIDDAVLVKE